MRSLSDNGDGFRRIRLIAALAAAGMFGMTAAEQFKGEPVGVIVLGILVSAAMGFSILWFVLTVVGFIMGKLKKDR
jgi:hypothetical protein